MHSTGADAAETATCTTIQPVSSTSVRVVPGGSLILLCFMLHTPPRSEFGKQTTSTSAVCIFWVFAALLERCSCTIASQGYQLPCNSRNTNQNAAATTAGHNPPLSSGHSCRAHNCFTHTYILSGCACVQSHQANPGRQGVAPVSALLTFWSNTHPDTSSLSSMVPPTLHTTRMSRRSSLHEWSEAAAAAAAGARMVKRQQQQQERPHSTISHVLAHMQNTTACKRHLCLMHTAQAEQQLHQ